MCGGRGAHDWLGEEGSTSGGLKVHCLCTYVHCLCTYVLLSCVYIYLRSASEESHKKTQEHSAHFTCGVHGRG